MSALTGNSIRTAANQQPQTNEAPGARVGGEISVEQPAAITPFLSTASKPALADGEQAIQTTVLQPTKTVTADRERDRDVPEPSMDEIEEYMRMENAQEGVELNDDVMDALRASDFTYNPDDDDEDNDENPHIILEKSQKNVAVLADNHKRHEPSNEMEAILSRWQFLVSALKPPLSTILTHAVVLTFDRMLVSIQLSKAFEGLLSREHEECVTREIRQLFHWSVEWRVAYVENVDESSSIAAKQAADELARQKKARIEFEQHPLFKAVMQKFQPEPSSVRFSFNNDRISS